MIQTYIRRRPNEPWNGQGLNGRVLDMGCGKGGDIAKWDYARIKDYVGCGMSTASLASPLLMVVSRCRRGLHPGL